MKTLLIAAAIAATSLSALADGATYEYPRVADSAITRAQVQDELKQAAATGGLASGERSYVAPAAGQSLTRADVRAALDEARQNNQLAHGEFAFRPATGSGGLRVAAR